ncbi:FIST C-terminal domain-containing protein [Tamlana sp. 62-3]|uniref:FIST C-terminal domain-containing protein n=1 Tax=Neotamlana sargassicola TaxID=2883125 RepID=A0A9X1L416_9FLAO|nr:FIST N-terminal domain-containing protein [Tamlana sargassicola]MCB4807727.1 FIST C-terminal domain-containing protein [Tamlana sargassicola]
MKVDQLLLSENNWKTKLSSINFNPQVFLCFVANSFESKESVVQFLKASYPDALIAGCSTVASISGVSVSNRDMCVTAIKFDNSTIKKVAVKIDSICGSENAGEEIGKKLYNKDLKHVIVFSDGININGSDLVVGLKKKLHNVSVSGGLASTNMEDNKNFVINDDDIVAKTVVGIGFYGDRLKIGNGSQGGWGSFGVERLVTKFNKNILYEIDGVPALTMYKKFLGDKLNAFLKKPDLTFSFSMRNGNSETRTVRAITGVNEDDQSLILGGNIYNNASVRLLKVTVDRLINGAEASAIAAKLTDKTELAILFSCVGRKNFLKQLVEEEVEVVSDILGENTCMTGFYAFGEIGPFKNLSTCELHNQTMTITTITEC